MVNVSRNRGNKKLREVKEMEIRISTSMYETVRQILFLVDLEYMCLFIGLGNLDFKIFEGLVNLNLDSGKSLMKGKK